MLSFQRAIFIKELQDKLEYWMLPATQESFYKGLDTNPLAPNMGIERNADGYFYLSDNLISYCNLRNGYVIRIRKHWTLSDWTCYTQLYQKGIETGKFRIDIPLYREEISIDNHVWEYAELQTPNNDYGTNFNNDVFEWPELINGITPNPSINDTLKDSVVQYYKEFIDQTIELKTCALEIAINNNVGLPKNLAQPTNRFKDTIGYFWSDFDQDQWINNNSEFTVYSLAILEGSMRFAQVCGVLDEPRVTDCLTYARSKWTTI
jgi:hypothetical protein